MKARQLIRESLELAAEMEFKSLMAHSLISYSEQEAMAGSAKEAARLIGAADAYFDRQAFRPQPADAPDFQRIRAFVQGLLSEVAYEAARRDGAALGLESVASRILDDGA